MKKVVLGMSGGVDSSVCALLLKEQGYEVIPVFMRNWDSTVNNEIIGVDIEEEDICPQEKDYIDAKRVCEQLGLKLHRVNFVDEYWNNVFEYFLKELKLGRTPNPDIMCNKYIKFDSFKAATKHFEPDYYAFGHYAITKIIDNEVHLYKGIDENKDQTYFLSQVSNDNLYDVIFPIGSLAKQEVRKLAEEHNLYTKTKKDSTGICFIGERNFPVFLQNYLKQSFGNVVNITTKEILGEHTGLANYTIGQRKGLNVGGASSALYVVAKDIEKNILYVCDEENKHELISYHCTVDDFNWINSNYGDNFTCQAKFRYRQADQSVIVEIVDGIINVKYEQGIEAVTPGQACVLYMNNECIGGGVISNVYNKNREKMVYIGGTDNVRG